MHYRVNGVKFYTRSRAQEAADALDVDIVVEISGEELADVIAESRAFAEAARVNWDMGRDEHHGC